MTLAKAPDEESKPFPNCGMEESRYYFNGKGAAGHHSAISHIYSEPHKQNQSNILTIKTEPVGSVFILCILKHSDLKVVSQIIFLFSCLTGWGKNVLFTSLKSRRNGRVVEGTGLENRRGFTPSVSSNLTSSAIKFKNP